MASFHNFKNLSKNLNVRNHILRSTKLVSRFSKRTTKTKYDNTLLHCYLNIVSTINLNEAC